MVLELGCEESGKLDEVVIDDSDDVEAIGDDAGFGEVSLDKSPVGTGEVDADELNTLATLEFAKKLDEVGFATTGLHFEDAVVFEITEGGAEALSFVEGMFVDPEDEGALKRDAFGGFATGELSVDALDGGFSKALSPGDGAGADSLVVLFEDGLAEGFGGVPAFDDTWKVRDEGAAAGEASESPGLDDEPGGFLKAIQVSNFTKISSFALNAGALAVRAALGLELRLQLDMKVEPIIVGSLQGVVTLQTYF